MQLCTVIITRYQLREWIHIYIYVSICVYIYTYTHTYIYRWNNNSASQLLVYQFACAACSHIRGRKRRTQRSFGQLVFNGSLGPQQLPNVMSTCCASNRPTNDVLDNLDFMRDSHDWPIWQLQRWMSFFNSSGLSLIKSSLYHRPSCSSIAQKDTWLHKE